MTGTTWRFIVDKNSYADFSVSVSPAVEKAVVNREVPPTIFLNIFDQDSITVGVNEDPEQVLDLDFCRANSIDFRRRANGGGAIYAGTGSAFLIYFVPTSHPDVPETTAEAFPKILTAFAETLSNIYGIPAKYRPLNDVQVEGRKMVPTSLKIENGVMTFRFVVNVKEMDTEVAAAAMPMPPEKTKDKVLKNLQSRFTCLERETGRNISPIDLENLTRVAVADVFGDPDLLVGGLTDAEHAYADEFRAEYDNNRWLYGKSEHNQFRPLLQRGDTVGYGREKAVGGMLWATLVVRDGVIFHALLNGDWHPRPIDSVARLEETLIGVLATVDAVRARVAGFLSDDEVEFAGVELDDLMSAFGKALADQKPTT
ncbi:MAG: hypothetical protein VYA17_08420 [Pseudomonadota bacterium]|nr:hypothetical protein [Pseudomonadota bacterium]